MIAVPWELEHFSSPHTCTQIRVSEAESSRAESGL